MDTYSVLSSSVEGTHSTNWTESLFTEQLVDVDGVYAAMLAVQVLVEATELLPFDHRQRGVQHVEIGDLDICGIDVVFLVIERNVFSELIASLGCAGGDSQHSDQFVIAHLNPHAHVDKRLLFLFQELDDRLF